MEHCGTLHAVGIHRSADDPVLAEALARIIIGERPSRSAVLASCAALAGVALVVGLGTEGALLGDALALFMTLSMAALMVLPTFETALIGTLDAPLAPIWVWLVFGETASMPTIAGGTIVMVAVVFHVLSGRKKPS